MNSVLMVAAGGAVGASARYFVNLVSLSLFGTAFPVATILVNVFGSLVMGFLAEASMLRLVISDNARAFLAVGLLGSFTTFSTFSLDFVGLVQRDRMAAAALYLIVSVTASIGALVLGMLAARRLFG